MSVISRMRPDDSSMHDGMELMAGMTGTVGVSPGRTTVCAVLLATLVCGCDAGDAGTEPATPSDPEPSPATVHVTHISLEPHIPPPDSQGAPPDAGWPDVGQDVTWIAHLLNSGGEPASDVGYRWTVDGDTVAAGTVDLEPETAVTVALPRSWSGERERIGIALIPPPELADGSPDDHRLTVLSDALSLGLATDSAVVERMATDGQLPPFAVWAAREVGQWNRILERYVGDAPAELLDRIRLDTIEGLPTGSPWPRKRTTDLYWYFGPITDARFVDAHAPREAFEDQTIVLHEILHQRGISDLYAYRVWHGRNGSAVLIREPSGEPAVGGPRMPYVMEWEDGGEVFDSPYRSRLMGADYSRSALIDPHTAYGLNRIHGLRTPRRVDRAGNAINGFMAGDPAGNDYLLQVPDSLRLHVRTRAAAAPAGSTLELFFDHADVTYSNTHGPDPDIVVELDADGSAVLSLETLQRPPGDPGQVDTDVVIGRLTVDDAWGYAFLPVYELNMHRVRGHRELADDTIEIEVQ